MEAEGYVSPPRHQCRACPANYLRRKGLARHALGVHYCGLGFRSTVLIPLTGEVLRRKLLRLRLQQRNGSVRRAQAADAARAGSGTSSSSSESRCLRTPSREFVAQPEMMVDCSGGQVQLVPLPEDPGRRSPLVLDSPLAAYRNPCDLPYHDLDSSVLVCPESPFQSSWELSSPLSPPAGQLEEVSLPSVGKEQNGLSHADVQGELEMVPWCTYGRVMAVMQ